MDNLANAQSLHCYHCQLEVMILRSFIWQLEGNGKKLKLIGSTDKSLMMLLQQLDEALLHLQPCPHIVSPIYDISQIRSGWVEKFITLEAQIIDAVAATRGSISSSSCLSPYCVSHISQMRSECFENVDRQILDAVAAT